MTCQGSSDVLVKKSKLSVAFRHAIFIRNNRTIHTLHHRYIFKSTNSVRRAVSLSPPNELKQSGNTFRRITKTLLLLSTRHPQLVSNNSTEHRPASSLSVATWGSSKSEWLLEKPTSLFEHKNGHRWSGLDGGQKLRNHYFWPPPPSQKLQLWIDAWPIIRVGCVCGGKGGEGEA